MDKPDVRFVDHWQQPTWNIEAMGKRRKQSDPIRPLLHILIYMKVLLHLNSWLRRCIDRLQFRPTCDRVNEVRINQRHCR